MLPVAAIALLASCGAPTAAPPDAPACSVACPAGDLGECTHAGDCSCTIAGDTFACTRPPTTFAHDGGVE